MTPRVLVLCEYASLNGGERSLLAGLDRLVPQLVDICVAAPSQGPLAQALAARHWPHIPLDLHDPAGRRLDLAICRQRIAAIVASTRPDLIHANSLSMSRLSGPVAVDCRLPSLGHLRDMIRINRPAVEDLNRHRRLLAVSQATADWYTQLGVERQKLHVLYNGVDLQRFRPRRPTGYLHRELDLPAGAPLIGCIGQIGMRKGLEVFAAAASAVTSQNPDVHFLIVGRRYSQKQEAIDYAAHLADVVARAPLAGRCHWLGSREDVAELLNELTLLVHAARQEPLGRVLLEAAAAGTPTIASDVGGTREIFMAAARAASGEEPDDPAAAALVPAGDPAVLAATITGLLGNAATRSTMSRAARRRAEAVFDARHSAERLLTHYRQVGAA